MDVLFGLTPSRSAAIPETYSSTPPIKRTCGVVRQGGKQEPRGVVVQTFATCQSIPGFQLLSPCRLRIDVTEDAVYLMQMVTLCSKYSDGCKRLDDWRIRGWIMGRERLIQSLKPGRRLRNRFHRRVRSRKRALTNIGKAGLAVVYKRALFLPINATTLTNPPHTPKLSEILHSPYSIDRFSGSLTPSRLSIPSNSLKKHP